MNLLYISKVSFSLYIKNLHWFVLFILPLPFLVEVFSENLIYISPYFNLFIELFVVFIVGIMGIILIDKIHHNEAGKTEVVTTSFRHILPVAGFNFQVLMIIIALWYVFSAVPKIQIVMIITLASIVILLLYLTLKWSLTQTLIVTENLGAFAAMKKSSDLMKGYKLPMFTMILLLSMAVSLFVYVYYLYVGAASYGFGDFTQAMDSTDALIMHTILNLFMPLILIHIYLFYQRRMSLLDDELNENKIL